MRYGIWRHENAFGNAAEHVINLANAIRDLDDDDVEIFVEHEWQKDMALCIPNVKENQIKFFPCLEDMKYSTSSWAGYDNEKLLDIRMPGVYPFPCQYPAHWDNLKKENVVLKCPDEYISKHNLPENAIVMTLREKSTFEHRNDGMNYENQRFVDPAPFHQLALYFANQGEKVVRIGSAKETPFPKHPNILDFAKVTDRRLLDDFYVIQKSKLFVCCDSGIWPIGAAMKKNMVVTNAYGVGGYMVWMSQYPTVKVLYKTNNFTTDNTFVDILTACYELL
jgi:putative glycosyltransferase (TIGR04372 family)